MHTAHSCVLCLEPKMPQFGLACCWQQTASTKKPGVLPRLTAFLSVVHLQPLICQQVHPDVPLQVLH